VQNINKSALDNVVGNIVIFIPLGIFLPLFKIDKRIITNLLLMFIISLLLKSFRGFLA